MTTQQQTQSRWPFEIFNSSGELIADLSSIAINRRVKLVRNRAGGASFDMDVNAFQQYCDRLGLNPTDLLSLYRNDLKIRKNNSYVYGGPLVFYQTISSKNIIKVHSVGYLDLLKSRYTTEPLEYTSDDAADIALALITHTQSQTNGNFGFSQGSIDASVDRDRTYSKYKNIYDAIVQLSEVINGFDFSVDHNKVFDVYYPAQGIENNAIEFRYPGNIRYFTLENDAVNLANRIIARGSGYGDSQIVSTNNDVPYQAAYKVFEKIYDFPDITIQGTLDQYSDGYNDIYKNPISTLSVTLDGNLLPTFGSYQLGDRVPVTIQLAEVVNIKKVLYKIDAMDIEIDDSDNELITLSLTAF